MAAALVFGVYGLLIAFWWWWPRESFVRLVEPVKTLVLLPITPPPDPRPSPPPPPPAIPDPGRRTPAMPDKQQPAPAVIPTQDPAPSPPIPVTAVPIFDVTPVKLAPPVAPGGGVDNTGPAAVGAAGVTTGIGNGAGSGNGGAGAGNVTVIRADWAEMLSWADIHPFHPRAALAKGMSGEATITCQVRRNKRAYNCLVRSEQPVGHGFGAAAVAMTRLYRIHPRKVDGKAIDDGRVFFKVGFYVTIAEARAALGLKQ